MRKFNQTINIEVSVDTIANQLLDKISPNFPHRENMVEAIISSCLEYRDGLSHVYNAINGCTPEMKFKIGDILNCKTNTYMYLTAESRAKKDSQRSPLGKCVVVNVNPYKTESICVEYDYYKIDGTTYKDTKWVEQNDCQLFNEISSPTHEDIFN